MKNNIVTSLIFLISFSSLYGQENSDSYWESLLMNDREAALSGVDEAYKKNKSLENFLAREIIRGENGSLTVSEDFVQEFSAFEENESYLFALWNESFLFGDYIRAGFSYKTIENIDLLYESSLKNKSVADGIKYLKAISSRQQNDFTEYKKLVKEIPGVRDWQFCGVFENLNNSGLETIYPPEAHPYSAENFNANSNGLINWYTPKLGPEPYILFSHHAEYGTGVHYAQTFVEVAEEKECVIRVGNSSGFKIWLNDVLIYENSKDLDTDLDAYNIKVSLPAGVNRFLLKNSESGSIGYFSVRITDDQGEPMQGLKYSSQYSKYNASTLEEINPRLVETEPELFFKDKRKNDGGNFLYDYCLVKTYLRNQRYEEAKKIVEPLYERYPTSSILRVLLIEIYQLEADNNAIEELKQNIELDDENYHITLAMKFVDVQELFRMSYNDMEKVLDNYAEATDNELIAISGKLIKALRLKDNKAIKKNIDKLMDISLDLGNIHGIKTYAPMYGDILNDEERSIKLLEDFNEEYFDLSVQRKLMVHYNGLNKRDKVIRMLEENVSRFEFDIAFYEEIIGFMLYAEEYKSALSYSDKMLELFPYSFMAMAYKGDALLQLGRIEEATEWYTKSLVHNSGNATLRQKIRDIRQEKDLIEEFRIEDAYQFIKDKRGVTKENNYGYNILLDEIIVELFEEAGGKQRSVQVYEITSEKGIESLKEYNLGLRYNYSIIKSEIVKKNGAVMPSEGNGSSFVFNGLEVGDVIYIDYQVNFNGSGRFFRDFVETHQFNSYHPTSLVSYTLLVPKDIEIFQNVTNGTLDYTKTDLETHVVHNWKLTDDSGLSTPEDYMPVNADVVTLLHLSTIENWSDIANWYSDLVRSQMEINSEVEKTFSSIFPDGTEELSEEKIAELIYRYIADNMSYSYVSFKQSGFVPQKPSKTITSKLGDCKDLSTLFVSLAEMAGLEANLVLVLTRDFGKNGLVLPSQDFNHCIVKVMIDEKPQYLELTDRYLPFKALPRTDRGALALEIPRTYDAEKTYDLIRLDSVNRIPNVLEYQLDIHVYDDHKDVTVKASVGGSHKPYTSSMLDEENYDVIKKDLEDRLKEQLGENCSMDTVYNILNEQKNSFVSYTAKVNLEEKIGKIGSFKILEVPHVVNAYTGNIVSEKERKYPIDYLDYESTDEYKMIYDFHLDEGRTFVEIPEDKLFEYAGHKYSRVYEKVDAGHLRVSVHVTPGTQNISPDEYPEYKKYVNLILEAKDEFIGFK